MKYIYSVSLENEAVYKFDTQERVCEEFGVFDVEGRRNYKWA